MNILRNSRYHLNPSHFLCNCNISVSNPSFSDVSSSGFPLFHRYFGSVASKYKLWSNFSTGNSIFHSDFVRYTCGIRLYATSVAVCNNSNGCKIAKPYSKNDLGSVNINYHPRPSSGSSCNHEKTPIMRKDIIDIVKNDASDMESRLDLLGLELSKLSLIEVFGVLNLLKVPALRFFDWIRNVHPRYSRNADLCSLAIDNCGRLGDFSTLRGLLKDFRARKISLSEKAFGFLNISDVTSQAAEKYIVEIVGLLNEAGGSCRNSGIHSLITMLCSLNLVHLAIYVIEITEKKASYYNIVIKHLCVNSQFESAQDMLAEMDRLKCDTNFTSYNYLISSLCMRGRIDEACAIPNTMIDRGCLPNELSFEILIYSNCRYGRSDDAVTIYNEMLSRGIKPRLPTYSAFIRGYVSAQRFDEAYRYVDEAIGKDKWSASHMYSVLASLHIEHGDLLITYKLLLEMFEKGINPKPSVYRRALNRLNKTGRSELAKILETRYSLLRFKESR